LPSSASILLRELSIEHLPTLTEDIPEIVNLIITSASVTTYDQIARQLLRMLLCIMQKSDGTLWNTVIQRLLSEVGKEASLFTRFCVVLIAVCTQLRMGVGRPDSTSLLVLEKLLCQMTTDMDSRVRLSAIEGLSTLSTVEDGLTIHTYNTVKNLVGDSHRQVRIIALRILLMFANKMPTFLIASSFSSATDAKLQLCDDAFSIVCDAVNDQEVMVRTEAATILGQFLTVSDAFLDQTLDKKMMKTVQDASGREQVKKVHQSRFAITQAPQRESRWKSHYQGQQRQKQYASDWSSGKELNARCPPSGSNASPEAESESIVPRGACGAFVSALEDEFMSVRRAAVYSLGRLAANRPAFATTALDHLSDMFNDEIVEVRLDAIAALTPLIVHGELQKEQLETVLKCLDDAILDSRQALRELLSKAEFADAECMRVCARALLNCLHRFPSDKSQIYRCLSEVGARHAVFVHGMVRELLGLHLVYDTREQQIDDEYRPLIPQTCPPSKKTASFPKKFLNMYGPRTDIAKLILILNAAANYEPIVSLLPECVLKHYRFLRAAAPDLVPPIKVLEKSSTISNSAVPSTSKEQPATTSDILVNAYERLQEVIREPTLADRNALRRYIVEDANAISAFNEPLAGAARFIASLCEISSALESLTQVVLRGGGDITDAANTVHQELVRVRCAEYQFAGIPPQMASFLVEAGMFLSLLELLVEMTTSPERYAQIVLSIRGVIADAQ
ncbi:HEAT repeat protein, partial [Ancylostoma duodenale]